MSTDPALVLAQWFSPAFPIGAFAYSHGLEWLIAEERVATALCVQNWCADLLANGTGLSDAIFLNAAFAADKVALDDLSDLCLAFCSSAGRRTETSEQGGAFARTLRGVYGVDIADMPYPVAVGRAARIMDLPVEATIRMYLQAFAANLISAAVRRVPLGQTDGQRSLSALLPLCEQVAATALQSDLNDLENSCFVSDIAAMRHETLPSKVFRT